MVLQLLHNLTKKKIMMKIEEWTFTSTKSNEKNVQKKRKKKNKKKIKRRRHEGLFSEKWKWKKTLNSVENSNNIQNFVLNL